MVTLVIKVLLDLIPRRSTARNVIQRILNPNTVLVINQPSRYRADRERNSQRWRERKCWYCEFAVRVHVADRIAIAVCVNSCPRHELIVPDAVFLMGFSG